MSQYLYKMNVAKIHLSAEEWALVQNEHILLTKNAIIQKVYLLFGGVAEELRPWYEKDDLAFPSILKAGPKISKGENYEGLPYVMLDYPRAFGKEDCLAVRTFFWWGHYFTVTLHLKGIYQQQLARRLENNAAVLAANNFRISLYGDEWNHDLGTSHWQDLPSAGISATSILEAPFCKLSAKVPFDEWKESYTRLLKKQQVIFDLLGT